MQAKQLFNGELLTTDGDGLSILNRETGEEICAITAETSEQVGAASATAHEAFQGFSQATPAERSELWTNIANVLQNNAEALAELESFDDGKPWPSAPEDETPLAAEYIVTLKSPQVTPLLAPKSVPKQDRCMQRELGGKPPVIALEEAAFDALGETVRYGFNWVNTHSVATPEMPWAAMKSSGTGSDISVYALDAYTAVRHIMISHG